jgi:nucleotide-binding universal stress UspA family protein
MKVLVPIDGSDASLRALRYVASHAAFFSAGGAMTIALIHVHPPIPSGRARSWVGPEALASYYDDESNAALAGALEEAGKCGVPVEVLKKVGEPGREIARFGTGYDMIVMGSHGRTALGNLVMGSVATRTIAESTTPVLLVK